MQDVVAEEKDVNRIGEIIDVQPSFTTSLEKTISQLFKKKYLGDMNEEFKISEVSKESNDKLSEKMKDFAKQYGIYNVKDWMFHVKEVHDYYCINAETIEEKKWQINFLFELRKTMYDVYCDTAKDKVQIERIKKKLNQAGKIYYWLGEEFLHTNDLKYSNDETKLGKKDIKQLEVELERLKKYDDSKKVRTEGKPLATLYLEIIDVLDDLVELYKERSNLKDDDRIKCLINERKCYNLLQMKKAVKKVSSKMKFDKK